LTVEMDEGILRKALEAATADMVRAEATQEAHEKGLALAQEARKQIKATPGPGITAKEARTKVTEALARVTAARQAVHDAQMALQKASSDAQEADLLEAAALRHEKMTATWKQQITAAIPEAVSDDTMIDLGQKRGEATKALQVGMEAARAKKARDEAHEIARQALLVLERAKRLRDLAIHADQPLEDVLNESGAAIRIVEGRMCVPNPARTGGIEAFDELSHGERWSVALDLSAHGLGAGGLLTVNQEAWESLDPEHREMVNKLAKDRKLTIVSAEATAGELRSEVYEGKTETKQKAKNGKGPVA